MPVLLVFSLLVVPFATWQFTGMAGDCFPRLKQRGRNDKMRSFTHALKVTVPQLSSSNCLYLMVGEGSPDKSHVEAEQNDVTVLDPVVSAFETRLTGFVRSGH
jgi:hypothetical protein